MPPPFWEFWGKPYPEDKAKAKRRKGRMSGDIEAQKKRAEDRIHDVITDEMGDCTYPEEIIAFVIGLRDAADNAVNQLKEVITKSERERHEAQQVLSSQEEGTPTPPG